MPPLIPHFCSQCAAPVVERVVDGRARHVCSRCGTVFYRNPLPVAAAVVLDAERRVLLVRRAREPHRGVWCLPTGFAEENETIADAALRELAEETGVEGRILQLADVDSFRSDFYGDLLVVTFEVVGVGGTPRPGDDAEAVDWFRLDALPPLAFSSNDKALAACQESHREAWAIQDSFRRLEGGSGQMLSDALVALVRDQADAVAALWLADVRTSPSTRSYARADPALLLASATTALSQFGRWLQGDEADSEVRTFYRAVGRERRDQGFAPHEVLSSLTLFRKNVWLFARDTGILARPIDVYRVLELDRRIVAFFDRAAYDAVRGWEEGGDSRA
ncbi:MAG: NUDIX domain-containing protein [Deltaproteobacteria bacterium]|nr:NUDIX domain-containing protein [Deltaproteobacteria bacterium]